MTSETSKQRKSLKKSDKETNQEPFVAENTSTHTYFSLFLSANSTFLNTDFSVLMFPF